MNIHPQLPTAHYTSVMGLFNESHMLEAAQLQLCVQLFCPPMAGVWMPG